MSTTSDAESQRGSPDDQFINVHDVDELRHWAHLLNITAEKLREVVLRTGSSAENVRKYLRGYYPHRPAD